MRYVLNLTQAQRQMMSQKAIQSVSILQMNSQELTDYIKDIAMENPLVDFVETDASSGEQDQKEAEEKIKKLEWLASLDEQNRSYYQYDYDDEMEDRGFNNLAGNISEKLEDILHMQLIHGEYSEEEKKVFDYIIYNLDGKGFFRIPLSEIAAANQVSEELAGHCLEIMRNLEPCGVCADSLRGCLLKQLEQCPDAGDLEMQIVSDYMELLSKNQLPTIAKKCKCDISDVVRAASVIRQMNPRPAQGFDNGELMRYVVPDITVVKLDDHFEILINSYTCPSIHVNKEYLKMFRTENKKEVKDYLLGKIQQVEEIQSCISRRNSTLLELAKCIVEVQQHFFLTGENSLRPFRLQEAAEMIHCHESTISRALKDKYLQCCWGVYPLNFFFPKGLSKLEETEDMAVIEVKKKLCALIDEEDKEKPCSDQALADALNMQGIAISRRTIAKYREELNIPNCRGRKIFDL